MTKEYVKRSKADKSNRGARDKRKVGPDNYGIQFVYVSKKPQGKMKQYEQCLRAKFGEGFYFGDFCENFGGCAVEGVLVLKGFQV